MSKRRQAGNSAGPLVLLLLLLVGLGGWNYHRNWQIEKESERKRPYKGYSVSDLEALREAYASELDGVRSRFDLAKRQRSRPTRDKASIADNVEQFDRTARASAAIRNAAGAVAEREGQVAEVERELALRASLGQGLQRHLKRLTTI